MLLGGFDLAILSSFYLTHFEQQLVGHHQGEHLLGTYGRETQHTGVPPYKLVSEQECRKPCSRCFTSRIYAGDFVHVAFAFAGS